MKTKTYKATLPATIMLVFGFIAEAQFYVKNLGTQTSSFNPNSTLITFRAALGMNMQGNCCCNLKEGIFHSHISTLPH